MPDGAGRCAVPCSGGTPATPAHCRGFVETLVLRAGCGRFDDNASFVIEGAEGLIAVILTSFLSDANGHICQVSVRPKAQGLGLGRLLVSAAMETFQRQERKGVSSRSTLSGLRMSETLLSLVTVMPSDPSSEKRFGVLPSNVISSQPSDNSA